MRCTQDAVLLEQVLNDRLLLPVDPAGEGENDEGKRRRQRVHGTSVPDRLAWCKTRRMSRSCAMGSGSSSEAQASWNCVEYGSSSSDPVSAEFSHRTPSCRQDRLKPRS